MADTALNVTLGRWRGAHSAYYRDDGLLVVEWYAFGDDEPYESANMLIFDQAEQNRLAETLDVEVKADRSPLLAQLRQRFDSYFAVKEWAKAHGVSCRKEVDFQP